MAKQQGRHPVDPETLPYRPCVGMMVLNRNGLVWTGHRIAEGNSEYDGSPQLWQMPQGGIDKGEDPLPAARRELYEETGIETVSLIAEAPGWINYDLPRESGRHRAERQVSRPDAEMVRLPLRGRRKRNPHQPAARRPRRRVRCLGMEAYGRVAGADRAVQAQGLRAGGRGLPASGQDRSDPPSTIIFLISAIALAGFSPFGQVCAQFMMVWQR